MFKVVKRSRSLRVGAPLGVVRQPHAGVGDEEGAHGPAAPFNTIPGLVSGPTLQDTKSRHAPQNADLSPVRFPDGRNPYLDRPLPPPPPPKNTAAAAAVQPPTMPARPSTSSGPGTSKTVKGTPNFDKRLSKDDMFLTSQMRMGMGMGKSKGLQPHRIGVRNGALPTPEPSPNNMASPLLPPSIPTRMQTPESLGSGEIPIGMALGSPSHASFQFGWQPQPQPQMQVHTPPRDVFAPPTVQQAPEPVVQRQKTQRRRLFGLFGSRKNSEPAKPVLTPEARDVSSNGISMATRSITPTQQGESTPFRSNTVGGKKAPKYKPIIVRSRTESQMETLVQEGGHGANSTASAWQPLVESSNLAPSNSTGGSVGLLDVEIPDIRLERYSIMFSGVLNPQGTPSSLLARRQATLEKLKTINDRIESEEEERERARYRRATSPQPTKSPGFTLFPPADPQTPRRLTPRMRSNTSPALLPSPSRAGFEFGLNQHPPEQQPQQATVKKERKTVTIISPRTMDERNRLAQVEKLREQQQQQQAETQRTQEETTHHVGRGHGFHFGPEESALILDSPQSMSSSEYYPGEEVAEPQLFPLPMPHAVPLKPTIPEPQWQMISPATSGVSGATGGSVASSVTTKRSLSSASSSAGSVQTQITRPSSPKLDLKIAEGDAALKAAVEISIARQISISRQQRQLLRPLQTNVVNVQTTTQGSGGGGGGGVVGRGMRRSASPNSATTTAKSKGVMTVAGGRVAETKFSTPTLVVPEETLDSQLALAAHRKSERVILEAA
ncbi:hypothetical protein QBC46DRAFT_417891 [Diplogelasinospora grovesii]|uniref:Uncharacterized protein n=1 Tax=Diplogelasinospora grovesii TaxID=303347 RepID=A0AAN6S8M2_9PEZI|nr:hypothetical protein QBC46DRAFT_417891 [Diplogelasinospora grovesii]